MAEPIQTIPTTGPAPQPATGGAGVPGQQPVSAPQTPEVKPDGGSKNFKILVVILLIVAALVLAGVGAYYFMSRQAPAPAEPVVTQQPSPTPAEEDVVVEDVEDLERLNQQLGQDEATLEGELNQLEQEANF